jgi:probable poly-beta-1,6-N-acetyl-D-glucosamine export protein
MYLNFVNYFRATAIIFIVAGHCLSLSDFGFTSDFGNIIVNILIGGTSFFVFISGFLFHHVFYRNFNFSKFMHKKVKFVLYPYLIMSFPQVIFYIFFGNNIQPYFRPIGDGIVNLYIIPFIKYYFSGFGIIAYWYIPFVMLIFLISPIFISFIRMKLNTKLFIIFPLLLISTLIHRPVGNSAYGVIQSLIYFLPIYLIGIISSENKTFIYSYLNGKAGFLFIIAILLATISMLFGQVANQHKAPFLYGGFDLMIFQKIVLCFAFMIFFSRYENHKNKLINLISENSFGIFFIHPILLMFIAKTKSVLNFNFPLNYFLIYIMFSILIITISLGLTLLVKKVFPVHSRSIVGS